MGSETASSKTSSRAHSSRTVVFWVGRRRHRTATYLPGLDDDRGAVHRAVPTNGRDSSAKAAGPVATGTSVPAGTRPGGSAATLITRASMTRYSGFWWWRGDPRPHTVAANR